MSIEVLRNVWRHSAAQGSELLLLLALADHANSQGLAWPGVATLAQKCRLGERHVRRLLGRLVETGELELLEAGRGRGHRCRYFVTAAALDPPEKPGKGGADSPLSTSGKADRQSPLSASEKGAPAPGKGGLQGPSYKESNPQEPSTERGGRGMSSGDREVVLNPALQGREDATGERGVVPEGLRAFDAELRCCPGYEPTEAFYRKVLEKYSGLDLEEQAMRIRGWFAEPRNRRRVCSCGFVLGWLADELDPGRRERRRAGASRRVAKQSKGGEPDGQRGVGLAPGRGLARYG